MKLKPGDRFRVVGRKPGSFLGERALDDGAVVRFEGEPLVEGRPLGPGASVVTVAHLGDGEYQVKDATDPVTPTVSSTEARSDGPAKVATTAYRAGFDRIFGRRRTSSALN